MSERNAVRLWGWLGMLAVFAGMPVLAQAHEVETCLVRLAQTSGLLKACQVRQSREGECDNLKSRLERNRQTCRDEQYPEEAIARAIGYGAGEVAGDAKGSPYRQGVKQQQQERSRMQPNLARFAKQFPNYGNFRDALAERFNSRLCPNAYEGSRDRWQYTGSLTLLQYGMGEKESAPPVQHEVYLFAQGKPGECYPVKEPLEPGAPFIVVNIPDQMLSQLELKAGVVKCESATCATDRIALEEQFQHYQATYRRYRQLRDCADLDQRNRARQTKGVPTPSVLPSYCPAKEVNVAMLNAKGLVEELDQRLFGRATRPLAVTKPK